MIEGSINSIVKLAGLLILPLVHLNYFTQAKVRLRTLYDKIVADEVNILLALFTLMLVVVVLPTAVYGEYSVGSFRESMWASVNAIIIDLAVGGVIFKFLVSRGSRRREIQQYLNEIDDLRVWNDQIAAHRIRGNILRLNNLATVQIDLTNCYLAQAQLAGVRLVNSTLVRCTLEGSDLENSELQLSDFYKANLKGAKLRNSNLSDAKLENCDLSKSDLSGAILKNAILRNSVLQDADLTSSILDGADLTGVTNLTPLQLSKAKSIIGLKIDERLLNRAVKMNPELEEFVEVGMQR